MDGNVTKSGPVPSLPLRRNHEKQSRIRRRKHMLYVVFPPHFNIFPFRFHLRNQVISSCVENWCCNSKERVSVQLSINSSADLKNDKQENGSRAFQKVALYNRGIWLSWQIQKKGMPLMLWLENSRALPFLDWGVYGV